MNTIRLALPLLAAAGLTACQANEPVVAQASKPEPAISDTVKAAIDNGIKMTMPNGQEFDFSYNPDGSLGGNLGIVGGTWTAKGPKLCIEVPGYASNQCLTYPDGKTSGDRFTANGANGPISIVIGKAA